MCLAGFAFAALSAGYCLPRTRQFTVTCGPLPGLVAPPSQTNNDGNRPSITPCLGMVRRGMARSRGFRGALLPTKTSKNGWARKGEETPRKIAAGKFPRRIPIFLPQFSCQFSEHPKVSIAEFGRWPISSLGGRIGRRGNDAST